MKSIVAGYDATNGAAAALTWAATLATRANADLAVITASPDGTAAPALPSGLGPVGPMSRVSVAGTPVPVLEEACDAHDADLLVLGATPTHWYPAPHLDHTAHWLLCHATRPTAIVPDGWSTPAVQQEVPLVVVGVDGTPGSAAAVAWVADLAGSADVHIAAVHVLSPPASSRLAPVRDVPPSWGNEVGTWLTPLINAGVVLSVRSVEGDPVTALRLAASDLHATAIVVGGRRPDPHRPLGVGSVTLRLLERSTTPVVLVPPPPA
jgi:nucleotide-binding universal stress UspA family protein